MIDNAVAVAMARAAETGRFPVLRKVELDEPVPMPHHAMQTSPTPARTGVISDLGELRSITFNRFDDYDQQTSSLRNRVSSLESHVFGDGPNAVSGR